MSEKPGGHIYDTDDRGIWVTADDGSVRIDLGANDVTAGYRLFLSPKLARQLIDLLTEAEIVAWAQEHGRGRRS